MPTINSYANDEGFYIRARPSNAGNITYKIKEEGNLVVWKHGLRDGDEISWSTIQSFKALGIIYTEQSGTLGPDDFRPDPEQLEKTELTESDAQDLFSIIISQFELTKEERTEIRSILGLSPEMDVEAIGDRIKTDLEEYADSVGLSVRPDRTVVDTEEIDISTWVEMENSTDYDSYRLHFLFVSEVNDEPRFTDHCIHLCEEHGLEHWHIRVLETPTWDIKRIAIEQKSVIFPRLLDELRAAEFELGDPADVLSPLIEYNEIGPSQ